MTQSGHAGTEGDGFGPTRFERSTQAVAPGAPRSTSAPLVTGSSAPRTAAGAPTGQFAAVPQTAVPPQTASIQHGSPVPPHAAAPAGAAKATSKASGRVGRARGPRRARLQLRNVNPWTVFKLSSALSVFLFLVWLIVIMLLFALLQATGVIGDVNRSVTTINGPGSSGVVNGGRVFLYAVVIGAVNSVLFIALSTIGSVIYNLFADLVGGVEVTLSERDN
jgi:hypothetical protein